MLPAVSVVIPAYNGAAFIGDALESVFSQQTLPREIVVVDDASTDGTADAVDRVGRLAPVAVRVVRLRENSGGPVRPLNVGIKQAAGPLVVLLEQDDRMAPAKITALGELLARFPGAGFAFGQYKYISSNGEIRPHESGLYDPFPAQGGLVPAANAFSVLMGDAFPFGGAGGIALSKEAWARLGGLNEAYPVTWDYDLAVRTALRGLPVAYAPETVYFRQLRDDSLSRGDGGVRSACQTAAVLIDALNHSALPREWKSAVVRALAARILGAAYWERRQGRYLASLYRYLLSLRCARTFLPGVAGICKLGVAFAIHSIVSPARHAHRR